MIRRRDRIGGALIWVAPNSGACDRMPLRQVTMREDTTLDCMCVEALGREPAQQAIEFAGEWVCWGQLRQVADQLNALIAQSGVHAETPIVFVPRNRPAIS
jgi:hypothetical protein